MDDPIASLRDAFAKAEAKTARLRSQLAAAEKELEELSTALRVMERFSGYGAAVTAANASVNDNGALILRYVGYGEEHGKAPKDLYEEISQDGHDLNADLVRTQLWRMAKRGALESRDGRYWRPASESFPRDTEFPPNDFRPEKINAVSSGNSSERQPQSTRSDDPGVRGSSSRHDDNPFDKAWDQDDDDVPF